MSDWRGQAPHGQQPNQPPYGQGGQGQPSYGQPSQGQPYLGQQNYGQHNNGQQQHSQVPNLPPAGYGQPSQPFGAMPPQPHDVRPGIMSLRPNDVGELIGVAFRGLKSAFWSILALEFLVVLIPGILAIIALVSFIGSNPDFDSHDPQLWSNVAGPLVLLIVAVLLMFALSVISQGAIIKVFAERVLGRKAKIGQCFKAGLRHMFAMLGLGILMFLMWVVLWIPFVLLITGIAAAGSSSSSSSEQAGVAVGLTILLGLPIMGCLAVWLFVKWSYAPYAIVMEEVGPVKAIGRSWKLTKGRWWPIFGAYVLAYIVIVAVTFALQILAGMLSGMVGLLPDSSSDNVTAPAIGAIIIGGLLMLVIFAVNMMTGPFMTFVQGASYLDTRIRKENLAPTLAAAAGSSAGPMTGHYMPAPGAGNYPNRPY